MLLLSDAAVRQAPFPYAVCARACAEDVLTALDAVCDGTVDWARHDDSFYACWLAVVSDRLPSALIDALRQRVESLLDLDLAPGAHVTVQRMEPGDHALPHTDRPQVGEEVARVVLHLNHAWSDADGGALEVLGGADGPVAERLYPARGAAFVFTMCPASHHAVCPTARPRRSVVFNFWHVGNTPDVARLVADLFAGARLDQLPRALDAQVTEAESRLPDDVTHRAGLVALALARWGYAPSVQAQGYAAALVAPVPRAVPGEDEEDLAIVLACWLTHLRLDPFEVPAWRALAQALAPIDPARTPTLADAWRACFPPRRSGPR